MARRSLVFAAGLLSDRTIWQPVADLLADVAEVRIVAFAGCRSIGAMAERLLEQAPPRFALAGHSMGARVALEAFARAPQRIERIALLNAGVHALAPDEAAGRERLVALAREQGMAAVAAEWLPPMMGGAGRADAEMMDALTAMVERNTPESFAGQIAALLDRPDAEGPLARVTAPTLLLSATEDGWSPPAQAEAMLASVPHAKLVIVQGAGHMAPIEQPEQVAQAIREWLERAP